MGWGTATGSGHRGYRPRGLPFFVWWVHLSGNVAGGNGSESGGCAPRSMVARGISPLLEDPGSRCPATPSPPVPSTSRRCRMRSMATPQSSSESLLRSVAARVCSLLSVSVRRLHPKLAWARDPHHRPQLRRVRFLLRPPMGFQSALLPFIERRLRRPLSRVRLPHSRCRRRLPSPLRPGGRPTPACTR